MAGVVFGQPPSLSGAWTTNAGGIYTLIDDSKGRIDVVPGTPSKPAGYGWLRRNENQRLLDGEVVVAGCWLQLSLEASEDRSTLAGSARLNVKKSTRGCLRDLTKEARNGARFEFALTRRSR